MTPAVVTQMRITIMSGTNKVVYVHISDVQEVLKKVDKTLDGDMFCDLTDFCADALESNPDAGRVDITPENAAEIFGGDSSGKAAPVELTEHHVKFLQSRGYSEVTSVQDAVNFYDHIPENQKAGFLAYAASWQPKPEQAAAVAVEPDTAAAAESQSTEAPQSAA